MPELTATGAVDVVQRQVRRVRRRKNFYELQRTLCLTIVAGATAAIILLPLALFAPTRVFALAAWSGGIGLAGLALLLVGGLRRRWIAREAVVPWIEERGALGGRLRTLLELAARTTPSRSFFYPLLVAEVGHELERWAPRRLVPWATPRAASMTALVAIAAFVLMLRLASSVVPAAPTVIAGDDLQPGAEIAADDGAIGAGRVVIAPPTAERRGDGGRAPGDGSHAESTLARLPSDLQESIRQQVWGKAWERVRESLARAGSGTASRSGAAGEDAESGDEGDQGLEVARESGSDTMRRRRPTLGHRTPEGADDLAGATAEAPPAGHASADAPHDADGGAGGAGAGSGTDPNLFGARTVEDGPAGGSFELSLAARLRADGAATRRGSGNAPSALADAHPELATEQRRENTAHRMVVPAAYEAVVREVFAHRREAPGPP